MLAEFEAFDVIYLQAGIVQQRQGSSHPFSSDPEAFDVTYLQVEARPLTQDLVMHRLPLRLLMPIAVTLLMTGMGPEAMIAGPMGGSTPHERRVMTGLVHTLCCKTRTEVSKPTLDFMSSRFCAAAEGLSSGAIDHMHINMCPCECSVGNIGQLPFYSHAHVWMHLL